MQSASVTVQADEVLEQDECYLQMVDDIEQGEFIPTAPSPASSSSTSRKKRSLVWTYFQQGNKDQAICDTCNEIILTSGNTTNMVKVHSHVLYADNVDKQSISFTASAA